MDKVTPQEVPRHLTYPKYEVPFKKWYEGHYECCFVLLHPFIGLPREATARVDDYPRAELVRSAGFKVPWSEVATSTGIGSCARLNNALLTSIGAITTRCQDRGAAATLGEWIEKQPVWAPSEGVFEELLEVDILWAFRHAGESVVHGIEELGLSSGVDLSMRSRRRPAGCRESSVASTAAGTRPPRTFSSWSTGTVSSRCSAVSRTSWARL